MNTLTLPENYLLHINNEIEINAPIAVAFEALLEQIGPANEMMNGRPMPMKLEPWPGGRWYRDLGDSAGHLWAHVQVIKPPTLLELTGPLCMSYACSNHVQYRLIEEGNRTRLVFMHRAIGEIVADHRDGMPSGWGYTMEKIKERAERSKRTAAAKK